MKFVLFAIVFVFSLSYATIESWSDEAAVRALCNTNIASLATSEEIDLAKYKCASAYNMNLVSENLNYNAFTTQHTEKVFGFQYLTTVMSFGLFGFIALVGLVFCYLEFKRGGDSTSTIKLGATELSVDSKVMGILILFLSLGFGYFFFDKAYKIDVASLQVPNSAPSK